ncbi:MAG: Spy/CpxP family protein refolding chaperone [Prevotella sp.]
MKKIVLVAAIALFSFGSMSAQRGGKQRMTPEEQVERMSKELNLTSDQKKKITALYTDFQKKREAAGQDSREQMRTEREKLNKEVNALLTDEQKKKFESMNQRGRGKK